MRRTAKIIAYRPQLKTVSLVRKNMTEKTRSVGSVSRHQISLIGMVILNHRLRFGKNFGTLLGIKAIRGFFRGQ